ncbi:MAG TPA: thioredoxin fold domain-containing protein [Verrucomicrobiae bacterium]|jgi:protein disulfide-isomerase
MKKIAWILLTVWAAGTARAEKAAWLRGFPEAAELARAENKLLLLDFTGSDWCGWCMKLDAETFSKAEFLDYAGQNLVLVQVDFPMHKSQPDSVKEANRALKNKFAVEGFPTIVIARPDGKVLWRQPGYAPGGPKVMIDAANQCRRAAGLGIPAKEPPPPAAAPAAATHVQRAAPPPPTPGGEPKLQGFVYSTKHSTAVLDGRICEEGESVHGMKVLKISRHEVTVEWQGQIKELTPH